MKNFLTVVFLFSFVLSYGEIIDPAPALGKAPTLEKAPVVSAAPYVAPAPYTAPSVSLGKAPYVSAAPKVSSSVKAKKIVSVSAAQKAAPAPKIEQSAESGNIIQIGQNTNIPEGTMQINVLSASEEQFPPGVKSPFKTNAAADKNTAVAKLKEWDAKLKNLQTDFEQDTSYEGILVSKSGGKLYFSAPNLIRLEQRSQDGVVSQVALTNKKDIKIFDADMKLVTSFKWKDWLDSQPNKALFDFGKYTELVNNHNIESFEVKNDNMYLLTLTPKIKTDEKYRLRIVMSAADFFPVSIGLEVDGLLTNAVLKNTQKNMGLKADVFKGI
ncbi:Outer membrane lipoprotein carrier [Elusimicrobium minutum Pei191]|uniref:Outer membrane lipoprotein carrier n=1 Tax=Elusimicrobium minutum (strain Pei191) TaxID=445932 RepID=B2KBH5_ELUMP|nr:outer membrane lipoprotein carrier protein LolA [Elusimicrobium minutum]ACC97997.1 Outer membrane lipoprotein carrier [Elusimicrobium minutum Pei191]